MERKIRFRIGLIVCMMAVIATVFIARMYKLQIVSGSETAAQSNTYTYYRTVSAARGNILDRNGTVLVTNRASYNIMLVSYVLTNSDDVNGYLLSLTETCQRLGITCNDAFPVTEAPYSYTLDELSQTQQEYFRAYLTNLGWDSDMSAENLIARMSKKYKIPDDWTDAQVRAVLGLRYQLDLRFLDQGTLPSLDNFVLASDVTAEQLAAFKELGVPGLIVETTTERQYNTPYAAHILGTVGLMSAEEYETLKDQGYAMNAKIGKDGLEEAFESYLKGTDGTQAVTVDSSGAVQQEYYSADPVPGNNVVLTLDIGLQAVAEDALSETVEDIRENGAGTSGEGQDAEGGAVVVMACKTGEVLASASYPTFDLSTYTEKFNELSKAEYAPLYDRALLAAYPPGSVYKMVTTIAAINNGICGPYYEITDLGKYTYYDGYQPQCSLYTATGRTHGTINVMQALSVSCNYYFYEIGRLTGINLIDEVAASLGLGDATGVELPESTGCRANPTTKKELYGNSSENVADWYGADTLQAAIGQSDNAFTPMQLACYVSALANDGVRYRATFLDRVVSSDYQSVLEETTPEQVGDTEISADAAYAVKEGMELASTEGTAAGTFADYPIAVCAKTGTAQHGGSGSDNASFVCYAPADDPEIAITIYLEKGAQGGALAPVAKKILDYYFANQDSSELLTGENTLK